MAPIQSRTRGSGGPGVAEPQGAVAPVGSAQVGVLTVDDHPSFRGAARAVIGATRGFRALAEVASGAEALAAADALAPGLVLMDVRMPEMDGLEATRRLLARHPRCVVVLVSADVAATSPAACRACGAAALVRKEDLRPRLLIELWDTYGGGGSGGSAR